LIREKVSQQRGAHNVLYGRKHPRPRRREEEQERKKKEKTGRQAKNRDQEGEGEEEEESQEVSLLKDDVLVYADTIAIIAATAATAHR